MTFPCKEITSSPSFTTRHVEMRIVAKNHFPRGSTRWMVHNGTSDWPYRNQHKISQLRYFCKVKSAEQNKANLWVAFVSYSFQELLPICLASTIACLLGGGSLCRPFSPCGVFSWQCLSKQLGAAWGSPGPGSLGPTLANAVERCQRTMWLHQEIQC